MKSGRDPGKDAEMSRLLQKRLKYEKEREALDQKIIEVSLRYAAIHNSCVPLLALPMEVTCVIFQYASGHPMEGDSEGEVPWLEIIVSHVCHQWRSISLAYPHLWRSFCYDDRESSLDRLDTYLERSGPCPLDLWFDFRKASFNNSLALLEKILPYTERWKCVTILSDELEGGPVSTFLSKIDAVSVPNLEHFALSCDPRCWLHTLSIDSLEPTIFTKGAPKLRSAMFDWSNLACIPPLFNITSLRLETQNFDPEPSFSWPTFVGLLSLPSLKNLSLAGIVFEYPTMGITSVITMANLIHLRCFSYDLSFWLPYLRAPLLDTLIIKDDCLEGDFGISVEPYTFPSLRSVSLIDTPSSSQAAWRFAKMTASATEFLFAADDLSRTLFSLLQSSEEFANQPYWTKVKLLTCSSVYTNDRASLNLLQFVQTRAKNDLVLRMSKRWDTIWRQSYAAEYAALTAACTIETMSHEDHPLFQRWPPGEYNPDHLHDHEVFHEGPFRFFDTDLH